MRALDSGIQLDRPLIGTPTAPTATVGTNTTQIATTAFVQPQIDAINNLYLGAEVVLNSGQSPYTLLLSDAGNRLTAILSFNQTYSIIIPQNSSVAYPIGTKIIINTSAAQPGYILLSGTGITFSGLLGDSPKIRYGSSFKITKIATDSWFVEENSLWRTRNSDGALVSNSGQIIDGSFSGAFFGGFVGIDNQTNITFGGTTSFNKSGNSNMYSGTSGTETGINTPILYAPTSGTGIYNNFTLNPTINQTGGANGITRALYINPTLTSTVDFRAIEVASGDSKFQKIITDNVIRLKNYIVATLPAGTQGDTAYVTDALAPTYLGVAVGGGAVCCKVFYNGTNWTT